MILIHGWLKVVSLFTLPEEQKSKRIETVLQHVLKDYTTEDLEMIINTFYNLLIFANIKDVRDFNNEPPSKLLAILKGYRALGKSSSTLVQKFIQTFIGLLLTGKKTEKYNKKNELFYNEMSS